jgi:3-oxoacyl-[acyl-carrier protein] reductase
MNIGLEHSVVALSGCASDIGQHIAAALTAEGASVYGCDLAAGKATAKDMADVACVDLTIRHAAAEWVRDIERKAGRAVDVLVHNAGGVGGQLARPLEDVSDDQWNSVIDINLNTAFALCRAVAPGMKKAGQGAIVLLGSSASFRASLTGIQAYCAAKHAVLGLTRQLAQELGPSGIRVNSVAPGFVLTSATQAQWDAMKPEGQARVLQGSALRKAVKAADIADATAFLAGTRSRMITGQILVVDGGRP